MTSQSKADYAYQIIKEKIISGELAPASTISEEALQMDLKISRTPIRDALQTLNKEGFVEIYPRKGIIVSALSLDLLKEVYDVRQIVEPIAARQACGKIPDKVLLDIRQKLTVPPAALQSEKELGDYYNLMDDQFHAAINQYLENSFLQSMMTIVSAHERRIRTSTFTIGTSDEVTGEHLELIEALLDKDAEKAFELATRHAQLSKKRAFFQILGL